MNRDQLLDWMVLEADGGLGEDERAQLASALERDADLRRVQGLIAHEWDDFRKLTAGLRLAPVTPGEIEELTQSRPEGILAWVPLKIAAAFVLVTGLWRGLEGPAPIARLQYAVARSDASIPGPASVPLFAGETRSVDGSVDAPRRRIVLQSGASIELSKGAVELTGPGEVTIMPGSRLLVRTGENELRTDLMGFTVVSRRGAFVVESRDGADGPRFWLRVLAGRVHHGGLRGPTLARVGETFEVPAPVALPSKMRPEPPRPPVETLPQPERLPPPSPPEPAEGRAPPGDGSPPKESRQQAEWILFQGQVTDILDGQGVARATAVAWPIEILDPRWALPADDGVVTEEGWRDLRLPRRLPEVTVRSAVTNHEGRFEWMLPPGRFMLEISGSATQATQREIIDLRACPGPTCEMGFVLEAGRKMRGQVFGSNGQSIEGATIRHGTSVLTSDASGTFTLRGLGPEEAILVEADGYRSRWYQVLPGTALQVTLEPVSRVAGLLRDVHGARVDARLCLTWNEGLLTVQQSFEVTNSYYFELPGVPAKRDVLLQVEAPGYAPLRQLLRADSPRDGTLVLELSRSLAGQETEYGLVAREVSDPGGDKDASALTLSTWSAVVDPSHHRGQRLRLQVWDDLGLRTFLVPVSGQVEDQPGSSAPAQVLVPVPSGS